MTYRLGTSGLCVVLCSLLAACGDSGGTDGGADMHAADMAGADMHAADMGGADLVSDQGAADAGADLGGDDLGSDAGTPDAGTDAGPCIPSATRPVDLLLVVDTSSSMVEEQASLAAGLPGFATTLSTGDVDGDGTPEFAPITDLHIGVITTDMGAGGRTDVPTCSAMGDDGVLLRVARGAAPGCAASYPAFLAYEPTTTPSYDVAMLSADAVCLARAGTGGCGFEQQLDAPLKALLPASDPTTFVAGGHGHGDDPATNGGFLRADSVLVVVVISDEDDCSTDTSDIWSPSSTAHAGDLNLRCIAYDSELYPTSRFVDGLGALRPGRPDVIFVAITGVPVDLVTDPVDYTALFADARMMNTIDGSTGGLLAACLAPAAGAAAPGIRLAHVAQAFGEQGVLASICQDDYSAVLAQIVSHVAARAACAP